MIAWVYTLIAGSNAFSMVLRSIRDFQKKYPTTAKVATGDNHCGTWYPKASIIITTPRMRMEYMAPFFRYLYFLIRSMLLTVSFRRTRAPRPFPMRISGIEKVKANAPTTPSMENVASRTSR